MNVDLSSKQVYTLTIDGESLGAIEKALAYYRDRAIVPDSSPVAELSRKFTTFLMKMKAEGIASLAHVEEPPKKALCAPESDDEGDQGVELPPEDETPTGESLESPAGSDEDGLDPFIEPLDAAVEEFFCSRCGRNPVDGVTTQICDVCRSVLKGDSDGS